MRQTIATVVLIFTTIFFIPSDDFLTQQKKFKHVQIAFEEKNDRVVKDLENKEIDKDHLNIILVAYKKERFLEIYGKNDSDTRYKLIIRYPFCFYIGLLGPKRTVGDKQIPEGLYHISAFNPTSQYFLSLKISYPNKSDSILGTQGRWGGDIFIHGECATIGCIPISNDIKELYLYAVYARNAGQLNIPIYIFPFMMRDDELDLYQKNKNYLFWQNLKTGYDIFSTNGSELVYRVNSNGEYIFN